MPLQTMKFNSLSLREIMKKIGFVVYWPPTTIKEVIYSSTAPADSLGVSYISEIENVIAVNFLHRDEISIVTLRGDKLNVEYSPTLVAPDDVLRGSIQGKLKSFSVKESISVPLVYDDDVLQYVFIPSKTGYVIKTDSARHPSIGNTNRVVVSIETRKISKNVETFWKTFTHAYTLLMSIASFVKPPRMPTADEVFMKLVEATSVQELVKERPEVVANLHYLDSPHSPLPLKAEVRSGRLYLLGHDVTELSRIVSDSVLTHFINNIANTSHIKKEIFRRALEIGGKVLPKKFIGRGFTDVDTEVPLQFGEYLLMNGIRPSEVTVDTLAEAVLTWLIEQYVNTRKPVYSKFSVKRYNVSEGTVAFTYSAGILTDAIIEEHAASVLGCTVSDNVITCSLKDFLKLVPVLVNPSERISRLVSEARNDEAKMRILKRAVEKTIRELGVMTDESYLPLLVDSVANALIHITPPKRKIVKKGDELVTVMEPRTLNVRIDPETLKRVTEPPVSADYKLKYDVALLDILKMLAHISKELGKAKVLE